MSSVVGHNPFSTCFTRPGKVPYFWPGSDRHSDNRVELESLIDRFVGNRCVGQIVGPHGCGKTTLCHVIADELGEIFPTVDYVAIRSGRDVEAMRYKNSLRDSSTTTGAKLTIVDGAERVSLLQQRMIVANLARSKSFDPELTDPSSRQKRSGLTPKLTNGLLFTSHRPLKFVPTLLSVAPSLAAFINVAKYLDPSLEMAEDQFAKLFGQADQNIREAIMLLYDRHESK